MCVKPFWKVFRIVAYSRLFISLKFVGCLRAAFPRLLFHWTFLILKQGQDCPLGMRKGFLQNNGQSDVHFFTTGLVFKSFCAHVPYDPWREESYVIRCFSNLFGHGILFVRTPNKHFMLWLVCSGAQSGSSGVEFMNKKDESICIE